MKASHYAQIFVIGAVTALALASVPHAQQRGARGGGAGGAQEPATNVGSWKSSVQLNMGTSMNNPYRMVPNWPKLAEKGIKPGAGIGIIPDGKGGIWALHRSEPPIIKVDSDGNVVQSWGNNMFASPHGFCRDRDGNFWAGDGGPFNDPPAAQLAEIKAKSFRIHKFSPEGKLLLTIGKGGVSQAGTDTFVMPASCVSMPNGNIMWGDGHVPRPSYAQKDGDRLVEITRDGKFVKSYGKQGNAPGDLWGPHALAYDSQGRLFVADRSNNRIQVFDKDMKFVDDWRHFSRPSGVWILRDDTIIVSDSESRYEGFNPSEYTARAAGDGRRNPGWQNGIRVGSAKDGSLKWFIPGTQPEGLAADEAGNIFGGLTGNCGPGTGGKPDVNCLQKWVKK